MATVIFLSAIPPRGNQKGMMRRVRRLAAGLVLGAAGLLLAFVLLLTLFQDRFIYFPDITRSDLTAAGLRRVAETHVATEDGLRLLAWTLPPADGGKPLVLYLHGNSGNLQGLRHRVAQLEALGWGAMFLEWRGYGGNPGSPGEAGFLRDARAALGAIAAQGVAPGRIVLWGESLGTGIAIALAAEQPRAIGAVLLESPYTSLLAVAAGHFPWLPLHWLLRDHYDSLARIGAITVPILIMTGGRDVVIPPWMSERLAAAARAPVERRLVPEAGHADLIQAVGIDVVADFLKRRLASDRRLAGDGDIR